MESALPPANSLEPKLLVLVLVLVPVPAPVPVLVPVLVPVQVQVQVPVLVPVQEQGPPREQNLPNHLPPAFV